jgi:hypothetical protein
MGLPFSLRFPFWPGARCEQDSLYYQWITVELELTRGGESRELSVLCRARHQVALLPNSEA